ncbi:MAG: hypothetical protein CFE37_11980 [Alphaproteobacteria bacterium PA4]|nr:MAG: hypothetical protein CFE37_11980 [Alphaproteobacteria bacterium PA4]
MFAANAAAAPMARDSVATAWQRRFGRDGLGIGFGSDLASDFDISFDLGDAIGTRSWWLGLASCTALVGTAFALAFAVPALPGRQQPALTPAQQEVAALQAIAPLARGGATGTTALPNARLLEPLAEAPERPRIELTAKLSGRASFESALRRAGVGKSDIADVSRLLRPVANLGALPRGTSLDIVLGRRESRSQPRPLDSIAFRAAFDLRVAVSRVDGTLRLKRIPIAVDSTPLRVQGVVGSSLQRGLKQSGLPARLVSQAIATLGYAVDFQRGVGKRDRFDIVVEQDRAETGEVRFGDVLYLALKRDGKDAVELGRFGAGGHPEYFRANGESARKGLMKTPVDGARLTSGFGMRFHPLLSYSRMHQGVDFGAASGSPIMAAASGTISFAGPHGGHGNYVMVKHTKDLTTAYAHMSRFAVRSGQRVTQGQVIGYVGSTGLSTGPHLHYEIWLKGRAVNPVQLKFVGGTQLGGRDMARFREQMAKWRRVAVTGSAPAETAMSPLEKKRRAARG